MKSLLYASLSILALAMAFHLGYSQADAQARTYDVLQARHILLVDEAGNTTGQIKTWTGSESATLFIGGIVLTEDPANPDAPSGHLSSGLLTLTDSEGRKAVVLSTALEQGSLTLYEDGAPRIELNAVRSMNGGLVSYDRSGQVQGEWPESVFHRR